MNEILIGLAVNALDRVVETFVSETDQGNAFFAPDSLLILVALSAASPVDQFILSPIPPIVIKSI